MVEACAAGFARRVECPARRVHPIQHRQHVLSDGLHAERHPGEPGRPQLLEQLRRCGLRIRLRRDLGVVGQREVRADRVEHRPQPGAAQQRRRPAADEHRVDGRRRAQPRRGQAELGPQGLQPPVRVRAAQLGGCVGVEVAVTAAGGAERHVDIDAERSARPGDQVGELHGSRSDRHITKCYATDAGQFARIPAGRGADGVPAVTTSLETSAILATGVRFSGHQLRSIHAHQISLF